MYKNQNLKKHHPEILLLIVSKAVFARQIIPITNWKGF